MRAPSYSLWASLLVFTCTIGSSAAALAHEVSGSDADFVRQISGPTFVPFLYLGAKHMVTGVDHVLYLAGVVFFLFDLRDVVLYVSMFAIGHSITLLTGVLLDTNASAHIVDAIIGMSVAYKGLENLGAFDKLRFAIDSRAAVFAFGLAHGLGLATKLVMLGPSENGLLVNLVGFNLGVEIGQILVLLPIVIVLNFLRSAPGFSAGAHVANVALVAAGAGLALYQIKEYLA